jgi:RHS repeat-associated protein
LLTSQTAGEQLQPALIVQSTNQISGLTYDAAGNIRTWNDGSMTHTYTFDAEGRLVSMDSGSVQYTYDVFGRRVEKNVNGTKDDYVYDLSGNVITDMNGVNGGWNRGEIWAGSRHLATYWNSTTYFSHSDWLGSDRVRTNVNGNIAQSCIANPYGDALVCFQISAPNPSPYDFAGMEYDPETGFYHTLYRYYNPRLASWITPDPAGLAAADLSNPQSLNRYAYALNAPTIYTDPLGLNAASEFPYDPCNDPDNPSGTILPSCDGDINGGGWGGWGFPPIISIPIGGGGSGPGGGGPTATGTTGNPGDIGNFPNGEHLGLPTGYNFGGLSSCQLSGLCPIGPGCDFGVCSYNPGTLTIPWVRPIGEVLGSWLGKIVSAVTPVLVVKQETDKNNRCVERYGKEAEFCSREYGGKYPKTYFKCIKRAEARFNACLRNMPDPGPLDPLDPTWSNY